jgi:protein quaking
VSALLGIPVLDQPGYQHGSPLINGGTMPNGRPVEMNGWAPAIPSEVWLLTTDVTIAIYSYELW